MPEKMQSFAALVKRQRNSVVEALQAGGHVPDIDANTAEPIDWIRCLTEEITDLMIEARFDISDPEVSKMVRLRLARLVAIAEAWDNQLTRP